jgi:hypothetical protein
MLLVQEELDIAADTAASTAESLQFVSLFFVLIAMVRPLRSVK